MNSEDKRKDIALILKINQTFNLTRTAEAKKVYTYVQTKKPFRTQIGAVFQTRLQRLANGGGRDFPCLFCKAENAPNGVICQDCIDKLTGKSNDTLVGRSTDTLTVKSINTLVRKSTDTRAGKSRKAEAKKAERAGTEKNAEIISKKAISAAHSLTGMAGKIFSFYKGLSKKNKIIAASVCVVIFLLLSAGAETAVTESSGNGNRIAATGTSSVTLSDIDSAQKYLEQIFPAGDYHLSVGPTMSIPLQMFAGEIGEARKWGNYGSLDQTTAYAFSVRDELPSRDPKFASGYVSEDGKIIAYGTMISDFYTSSDTGYLRIK
ncbi:MAG: hypothetical protein NC400_11615 [Clostridium sp.]|nr:hypothetical protein [Clostridium sp.]